MIQLVPSSTKDSLTLTQHLNNIPILVKSSSGSTFKETTTTTIHTNTKKERAAGDISTVVRITANTQLPATVDADPSTVEVFNVLGELKKRKQKPQSPA
jgi:hypothetical protein